MNRRRAILTIGGMGFLAMPGGVSPSGPFIGFPPNGDGLQCANAGSIQVTGTNSPLLAGEVLEVEFKIECTIDRQVSSTVDLAIDGVRVDSTDVIISQDAAVVGTLSWQTEEGSGTTEGEAYEVTVSTGIERDTVTIYITSQTDERAGSVFHFAVNAVEDLGLDPSGNDPIEDELESLEPKTLVQFPAGEYLIAETTSVEGGYLGLEGQGEVRFVVPEGYSDNVLEGREIKVMYISDIDVDQTASHSAAGFDLHGDRIHIQHMEFIGRADVWNTASNDMLDISIETSTGYGEIRNVVHKEGHWARYGPSSSGRIGVYTGRRHKGTLKIVDCDLREFGNNALYCSKTQPEGRVEVEDSYFENNNVSSIRIGGEGSYAENCTIVIDPSTYSGPRTYELDNFSLRGIVIEERFESGDIQKPAGAEIRNCDIRIEDNPANGAAIHRWGNGRSMRVVGTTIEYNNDGYDTAILVTSGGMGKNPEADPPKQFEFIGSELHGTGEVDAAIIIDGADDSIITDSLIHMHDGGQDGVWIHNSIGCIIEDSTIDVPGNPTEFVQAEVTVENIELEHQDI